MHTCDGEIYTGRTLVRCGKTAKVEVDGKHYCGLHDPARKAARRAKTDAKYDAKHAVWRAHDVISKLRNEIVLDAMAHPDFAAHRLRMDDAQNALDAAKRKLEEL